MRDIYIICINRISTAKRILKFGYVKYFISLWLERKKYTFLKIRSKTTGRFKKKGKKKKRKNIPLLSVKKIL